MILKGDQEMLNCLSDLAFSSTQAEKRLEKANKVLGHSVTSKIMAFSLFLFGANREDISKHLGIPLGTLLSFLTRMDHYGIYGFADRRKSQNTLPQKQNIDFKPSLTIRDEHISIQLGNNKQTLKIPLKNSLQSKVVLLTFLNSGLLSINEVSNSLGFTVRHVRDLSKKLEEEDAYSFIDKRKGQTKDYRFTPEVKSEIIQQFAANTITGKSTSSIILSEQIKERCNLDLAPRSIRYHVEKIGLPRLENSLPNLVDSIKKNSDQ